MADEIETGEGQVVENNTPQYTDIELKAMEMGWRPKEEFNGDETDFIDAKEFVGRKPLYDKISDQSKQLKRVTEAVESLKQHYTKVQETEFKRALQALKAERTQAIIDGDADKVNSLDDHIEQAKAAVAEIQEVAKKPAVQEDVINPEFSAWKNKNPWYDTTKYMKEFADEVGVRFHKEGKSPSEVLKLVEQAVREEFPHKFRNPNKDNAPSVGESKPSGRKPKDSDIELSAEERKIMNTLVAAKVLTQEEYLADLKKVKGIK